MIMSDSIVFLYQKMRKTCSYCKIEKWIEDFPKKGIQFKECQKQKREKVKEKKRQYDTQYRSENKDTLSQQWKMYGQENKIEIRVRHKHYVKNRRANDPIFRLRTNVSKSIWQMLKSNGSSKKGESFLAHLPYTIQELKNHLESQFESWMNWESQGKYNIKTWDDNNASTWTWNIDHVMPHSDLPYTSMEDENFKKCWALENLRPLSAKQNLLEGVTRMRHNLDGKNE